MRSSDLFMLNYVTRVLHMTLKDMLIATAIGAMTTTVGFAVLSDRIGRRRLMITSGVLIGLWAFPIFWVSTLARSGALSSARQLPRSSTP